MTVYVDDAQIPAQVGRIHGRWSHLTADTEEELHTFAQKIGLKRSWFQKGKQSWMNHYDVTESMRQRAIKAGATSITWQEAGEMAWKAAKN